MINAIRHSLFQDVAEGLTNFIEREFPQHKLIERHDRSFRYKLFGDITLASVFGSLEASKVKLGVAEYGVAQTTLEQIFNQFAAQQEEETGDVRGMVG